jgi:thymidylate kinase
MKQYLQGFEMMKFAYHNNINLIFDRFHIGEYVYSPIYRNYSGEFIFEIEKQFKFEKFFGNIFLTVMVDEAKSVSKREDGLSFSGKDIDLKISEKRRFTIGFTKSNIINKQLINCSNYNCNINDVVEAVKKGLNL